MSDSNSYTVVAFSSVKAAAIGSARRWPASATDKRERRRRPMATAHVGIRRWPLMQTNLTGQPALATDDGGLHRRPMQAAHPGRLRRESTQEAGAGNRVPRLPNCNPGDSSNPQSDCTDIEREHFLQSRALPAQATDAGYQRWPTSPISCAGSPRGRPLRSAEPGCRRLPPASANAARDLRRSPAQAPLAAGRHGVPTGVIPRRLGPVRGPCQLLAKANHQSFFLR